MRKSVKVVLAIAALSALYIGGRALKVTSDQQNVHEVHPWVFQNMDTSKEQLGYVFLDYDFKDVDRCILQATAVRRGKSTVLRIKCLKVP